MTCADRSDRLTAFEKVGLGTYEDLIVDPILQHKSRPKQLKFEAGHAGLGLILDGFGGDGCYRVSAARDSKTGLVNSVTIEFNRPEGLEKREYLGEV